MSLFAEAFQPVHMLLAAALAVVTWVLLTRSQRYFSQQRRAEQTSEPAANPVSYDRGRSLDLPDAAARWEVQMHDTARELSAQLDSKISALQTLIADADRAAARLEAALDRSPAHAQAAGAAAAAAEAEQPPRDSPMPEPRNQAEALQAPQGVRHPAAASPLLCGGGPERAMQDKQRDEIYTLADYGFEPGEIASRSGRPIGEVQLILGLRGKEQG